MKHERIKAMGSSVPRVIVPSLRYKADGRGNYVPAADVSPAEAYGEIVYLTTPGNAYINQTAINDAINKLDDLCEDDIILLTGDILFCAIALGEMAMRFGKVRILRWDGRDGTYTLEQWDWPTGFSPETPSIDDILARHEEEMDYGRDCQP